MYLYNYILYLFVITLYIQLIPIFIDIPWSCKHSNIIFKNFFKSDF